jgi:hypothetical protein
VGVLSIRKRPVRKSDTKQLWAMYQQIESIESCPTEQGIAFNHGRSRKSASNKSFVAHCLCGKSKGQRRNRPKEENSDRRGLFLKKARYRDIWE